MKLFFGSFMLVCILLFDEIAASLLSKLKIRTKKKDEVESSGVGHIYTSRAGRLPVPVENQPSLGQRALDLHVNEPAVQEYSHQRASEERPRGERKSKRQKKVNAMAAVFAEHYGFYPRHLRKDIDVLRQTRTASNLATQNSDQSGVPGTNVFFDPPLLEFSNMNLAGNSFNPNFAGQSGGYGNQGYNDPPSYPNSWGNFGDPGPGFGGSGSGYGGSGSGYGGSGSGYGGSGSSYGGGESGYGG